MKEKTADPLRFPDLSLAVIKLLGAGEYVAENPGNPVPGHFGLAVRDCTHSTAPNRRYTDVVTQRLLKAAIAGDSPPYNEEELGLLAAHCTKEEDTVNKVERQVGKSASRQRRFCFSRGSAKSSTRWPRALPRKAPGFGLSPCLLRGD